MGRRVCLLLILAVFVMVCVGSAWAGGAKSKYPRQTTKDEILKVEKLRAEEPKREKLSRYDFFHFKDLAERIKAHHAE